MNRNAKLPLLAVVYDRKKLATRSGKREAKRGSVELRITYKRKQKYISTGVRVFLDQWSDSMGVVNCPTMIEDNERINAIRNRIQEHITRCYKAGKVINLDELGEVAQAKVLSGSFVDFVAKRMEERQVKESTRERYRCFHRWLKEYKKLTLFSDLTSFRIKEMNEDLARLNLKTSTIHNYNKYMKLFIHDAILAELMDKNPYDGFSDKRPNYDNIEYLTEEEMVAIRTCKLQEPYLQKARDLFVFQMYTGMAYADMKTFSISDYTLENGTYRYNGQRVKTGGMFIMQLLKPVVEVLEKYDYKLPVISAEKYNEYLKVIGAIAQVGKRMHSHLARHTFATWMLSKGVGVQNLQKMMGHQNIRQTMKYAKVLAKDVHNEFDKVNELL